MSRGIDKPSKSCVPGLLAAHEERYKEAQDAITRLQSEVERLRGRCSELEYKYQELLAEKNFIGRKGLKALFLRKQAEAVESTADAMALQGCNPSDTYEVRLRAQRLRNQADELEHSDGRS